MTKEDQLEEVKARIKNNNNLPLKQGATNLVFGEGNAHSKIVFIGEAPGFHEDRLGRPFVGNAGNLLDRLLAIAGFKREEIYITNLIKYRPPENRDPEPKEIAAFLPYLVSQLEIINPKFVVTLGRFSMNFFLPKAKISTCHGQANTVNGRIVIPMFHPAAALRSASVMSAVETDFGKLPQILVFPQDFLVEENKNVEKDDNQMSLF